MNNNRAGIELERFGQSGPQWIDALTMGPNGQLAVSIKRQSARGRDRSMRQITAGIGRFIALPALRIGRFGRAEYTLDHRPLQQPAGFLLGRRGRLHILPGHMIDGGDARGLDSGFIVDQ